MAMMQTKGAARNSPSDSRHEPGQSAEGRAPDPWRTPQTRHRNWPNLGRQVYGKAQETPIARVEDIPPQPRRWDCLSGSLRRSDTLISAALWLVDYATRPTDPWRTPQTRHRNSAKPRSPSIWKAQETPFARLEDIPPQPRGARPQRIGQAHVANQKANFERHLWSASSPSAHKRRGRPTRSATSSRISPQLA